MDMYEMSRWHPLHPDNIREEDYNYQDDQETKIMLLSSGKSLSDYRGQQKNDYASAGR